MEPISTMTAIALLRVATMVANRLSHTKAGEAVGSHVQAGASAVAYSGRELSRLVDTEIAAGRVRGQLRKDLEHLDRELRTGGVTDDEYARRVAFTIEGATAELDELGVLQSDAEAPQTPKPMPPVEEVYGMAKPGATWTRVARGGSDVADKYVAWGTCFRCQVRLGDKVLYDTGL